MRGPFSMAALALPKHAKPLQKCSTVAERPLGPDNLTGRRSYRKLSVNPMLPFRSWRPGPGKTTKFTPNDVLRAANLTFDRNVSDALPSASLGNFASATDVRNIAGMFASHPVRTTRPNA